MIEVMEKECPQDHGMCLLFHLLSLSFTNGCIELAGQRPNPLLVVRSRREKCELFFCISCSLLTPNIVLSQYLHP